MSTTSDSGRREGPNKRFGGSEIRKGLGPLQQFVQTEHAGGAMLGIAAVIALIWANTFPDAYDDFWHQDIGLTIGDWTPSLTLEHFVVDGLMALFFFVVGMEIKRELTIGELRERRVALLPVFAAAGGMVVPAAVFVIIALGAGDTEALRGWGIPMATDIAFALGALSLVSRHVPVQLAVFLLAVAVVDDIGAIAVIAIFYTSGVSLLWLGACVAVLGLVHLAVRRHAQIAPIYIALGILAWYAAYKSGVHPTIAGVAMGLLMPVYSTRPDNSAIPAALGEVDRIERVRGDHGQEISGWQSLSRLGRESVPILERYEYFLHPWTSFLILPLFALAEAGIVIRGDTVEAAATSPITIGVAAGLIVGKILGIFLGAWIPTRLGLCDLPERVYWPHIAGVGALAGIGFTVAIFVAGLAYEDDALVDEAKIGILLASVAAAVLGALWLRFVGHLDDGVLDRDEIDLTTGETGSPV